MARKFNRVCGETAAARWQRLRKEPSTQGLKDRSADFKARVTHFRENEGMGSKESYAFAAREFAPEGVVAPPPPPPPDEAPAPPPADTPATAQVELDWPAMVRWVTLNLDVNETVDYVGGPTPNGAMRLLTEARADAQWFFKEFGAHDYKAAMQAAAADKEKRKRDDGGPVTYALDRLAATRQHTVSASGAQGLLGQRRMAPSSRVVGTA